MRRYSFMAGAIALALATAPSAVAQKKPKKPKKKPSVTRCMDYSQDLGDDGMNVTLKNSCEFDVDCHLSWKVYCVKDDESPGSRHNGSSSVSIPESDTGSVFASAAVCGEQGWRIGNVRWTCHGADDQ